MKFFISHASQDNQFAKQVVEILKQKSIESYWIDFEKIKDGDKIRKEINNGIENATHFLLLWTKFAKDSEWVEDEINGVSSHPYKDQTQMIIFKLDETPLRPLDVDRRRRSVSPETVNEHLDEIIEVYSTDFSTQLKNYKKKVCEQYKDPPRFPHTPIIKNFKKLEKGSKYFVRQQYINLRTQEKGEDIFAHIKETISKNLGKIGDHRSISRELKLIEEQSSVLFQDKEIVTNIELLESVDRKKFERTIWEKCGLTEKVIQEIERINFIRSLITKQKNSVKKIEENEKFLLEDKKLQNRISSLKEEQIKLEKIDLEKASIEELEKRKIRLEEIPKEIDRLNRIFDQHSETHIKKHEEIGKEKIFLSSLEEYEDDFKSINTEWKKIVSDNSKAISLGEKIFKDVNKFKRLKSRKESLSNDLIQLQKEKLIPIIGDYGSGKSALSNHLIASLCENDDDDFIPLFVPLGIFPRGIVSRILF